MVEGFALQINHKEVTCFAEDAAFDFLKIMKSKVDKPRR